MRKKLPTIILILVFLIGLSLLLYPTVSDYWNSFHQTRAVATYSEDIANISDETYEGLLEEARAYNEALQENGAHWTLTEEELEEYNGILDMSSTGVMGYIDIPKINCTLPIYHGTGDVALQKGAGHLEGSSFPVGGTSTHAVLSSHRGLTAARLFTDLDQLSAGDTFTITVLNEVLTYEVDRILTVLPTELDALTIEEGMDYCTLVTCTPYGINTHRLLVRGHRIDTEEASAVRVTGDAILLESRAIAPLVAVPILTVLLIVLLFVTRKRQAPEKVGDPKANEKKQMAGRKRKKPETDYHNRRERL